MTGPWCRWEGETLKLRVRVRPRSARSEMAGIRAGALHIRLGAPPVDGKANHQLIDLLARAFAVPRTRVRIVRGAGGVDKTLAIEGPRRLPPELEAVLPPADPRGPTGG